MSPPSKTNTFLLGADFEPKQPKGVFFLTLKSFFCIKNSNFIDRFTIQTSVKTSNLVHTKFGPEKLHYHGKVNFSRLTVIKVTTSFSKYLRLGTD